MVNGCACLLGRVFSARQLSDTSMRRCVRGCMERRWGCLLLLEERTRAWLCWCQAGSSVPACRRRAPDAAPLSGPLRCFALSVSIDAVIPHSHRGSYTEHSVWNTLICFVSDGTLEALSSTESLWKWVSWDNLRKLSFKKNFSYLFKLLILYLGIAD